MMTLTAHAAGDDARQAHKTFRSFLPSATLKCIGRPMFRSQQARDYACLLDLDPEVVSWRATVDAITDESSSRQWSVDLAVETTSEPLLVEIRATIRSATPSWVPVAIGRMGYRYRSILIHNPPELRLRNAKDLFAYGVSSAPLGDRIRILAALEEAGSLTLAEILSAVREGRPMHTVASMILNGLLEVDLDEALLGPDTAVRRAAR